MPCVGPHYPLDIRIEAAGFVRQFCYQTSFSRRMFIACGAPSCSLLLCCGPCDWCELFAMRPLSFVAVALARHELAVPCASCSPRLPSWLIVLCTLVFAGGLPVLVSFLQEDYLHCKTLIWNAIDCIRHVFDITVRTLFPLSTNSQLTF